MSSDGAWFLGLGVVAGILFAASQQDKTTPKPKQPPQGSVEQKSPDQIEAEKIVSLLNGGHHTEAVSRACKVLFGLIRRKSGVEDKDTMHLIDHVFGNKSPILRFTRHDGYPHLKSHEGYYFLLKGISLAFRNPSSHENIEMSRAEAASQIGMVSHMYEMIDKHTAPVPEKITA